MPISFKQKSLLLISALLAATVSTTSFAASGNISAPGCGTLSGNNWIMKNNNGQYTWDMSYNTGRTTYTDSAGTLMRYFGIYTESTSSCTASRIEVVSSTYDNSVAAVIPTMQLSSAQNNSSNVSVYKLYNAPKAANNRPCGTRSTHVVTAGGSRTTFNLNSGSCPSAGF